MLAYVALGANLGDPVATLRAAITALGGVPQSACIAVSSLYRSAPVGLTQQPDFINAVAALETGLSPQALLDELFRIEARFGRQRSVKNAPRTLDLDLLLHDGQTLQTATLTLPHPRMTERAFVLLPLAEIAPTLAIPGHGLLAGLLKTCAHQRIQKIVSCPPVFPDS